MLTLRLLDCARPVEVLELLDHLQLCWGQLVPPEGDVIPHVQGLLAALGARPDDPHVRAEVLVHRAVELQLWVLGVLGAVHLV